METKIEGITGYDLYNVIKLDDQKLIRELDGKEYFLEGWVRTNRDNGAIGFIEFNDGTYYKNVQLVYLKDNVKDYEAYAHLPTGAAISVTGKIKLTPEAKQPFELEVIEIALLGDVDPDYPLQKKRHTFEYLRNLAHLRPRTNTFYAVFRVRSVLSMAIHEFFQSEGFVYVHTPIITGTDSEGAGETFNVNVGPKKSDDFFSTSARLTVSGQLHVEPFALAFRDVYTFGPTFRAEKSNTPRHASEFWMVEPEIAFADLHDDMNLIESCIKFCIQYVIDNCPEEMKFFNTMIDTSLMDRLNHVLNSPFEVLTYTEAVKKLLEAKASGHKFENEDIKWGMDFQSEHDRYITDVVVKGPVFIIDYPEEIKAFYMRLNDDNKTVAACDLLVPGVGELVGGSQREERYDILKKKMDKLGMKEDMEWYLDTRKYGGCKHAGFGIGFDRLLMYVTGMQNIRDVQPYPRTANQLKY